MRSKISIDDACKIANERGGECLSRICINSSSHLEWRYTKGHEWTASFSNIKYQRSWCPYCAGNIRHTLETAKLVAFNRGGECLSKKYINCNIRHTWMACLNSVKNNKSWCWACTGKKPYTIEDVKLIAHSRNGECLSEKYINCHLPLKWRCYKGHVWSADLQHIKDRKQWCPYCQNYQRENLCREIVTKYLGPPSKNRKPNFLKTSEYPTGLELDIPYYEYGFAIEVQGEQHEKYIEFFHRRDPNNFIKQQERDQLKKELCEENWIALRYVWYYEDPYIVIPEHHRELDLIE